MAQFEIDFGNWADEDAEKFAEAEKLMEGFAKRSVWEGAKVSADAVAAAAREHGNLADGLKVAKMRTADGDVNTIIWFDGYDTDGVAFAIKANALESGTSDERQTATHFFSKALRKSSKASKAAMESEFNKLINEVLNKGE